MRVTMSVSVPMPWVDDIENRATELGYSNRSEYVRSLVEEDIDGDEETKVTLATDGNHSSQATDD